ncbi:MULTISPECIES: hypothetical protein [unclassified Ornithinimicrobium]|uniref:hypothetical protein n=1 Tax=unclassified Ornithinimicrobium TaxID=2615080 RepID=UPI003851B99E
MMVTNVGAALSAGAAALVLWSCGDLSPAATTATPGGHGAVVQVYEDVAFYPACGNEVLDLNGTTWYQLLPDEQDILDQGRDPESSVGPASPERFTSVGSSAIPAEVPMMTLRGGIHVPMVVAPGPGDDTGEVTVFTDGLALFESDSGDLTTWLTTEERTYTWAC